MLNGSLDTVALPDVLRLIASSEKSGLLRVDDASPSGRIFIVDGRVAFATNRNDDDPIDDLMHMEYRADYVGSPDDRRIVDMTDLMENNPEAFHGFLEQMVVEVLSRLLRVDSGRFQFAADVRSRREIPHSFEVEDIIKKAAGRAEAWTRILETIPSTSEPFRLAPRLEDPDNVVLGRRDWALLATTGVSTTVNDIALELKIFEFAAAKKVAELAQRGLIEFIRTEVSESSMSATDLLSDLVVPDMIEVEGLDRQQPEEPQEPEETTPEVSDKAPAGAEEEQAGEAAAPNWLPIENAADDDGDPQPLLEELHRLHEAENAENGPVEATTPEVEKAEEPDSQPAHVADGTNDGDLATRWKNLRKAKRGAHSS